ncbi:hypothetical protein [Streptomyces spinosus]|uniref:hypothetical protein n=1 Tax=Streptomyces spinosus TaxID=2872623 RepID=UPI001CED23A4|nr:hypothetical protein [Streptomyces spinosus]
MGGPRTAATPPHPARIGSSRPPRGTWPATPTRTCELVGTFASTDARAVAALWAAHGLDASPAVRKKAGWYVPGGTVNERTVLRVLG